MIKLIQWLNPEQREKIDRIIEYIEEKTNIPLASVYDSTAMNYVKFLFRGGGYIILTFEFLEMDDEYIIKGVAMELEEMKGRIEDKEFYE